jgi:hypothetical protein
VFPVHPRRRLTDEITDYRFALVQLDMMQRQGRAHHTQHLGLKLALLHRRLDELEARLRRRARLHGIDPGLPTNDLLRRLEGSYDLRQRARPAGDRRAPQAYWQE